MAKQTPFDKVYSALNKARYNAVEPLMLRRARNLNTFDYRRTDPLISVYVPTYNRGEVLIERAVKSILAQTYENFELIVIGDCCTDNTPALMAGVTDSRVRFYNNLTKRNWRYPPTAENHWLAGPVVAANAALTQITGQWIARNDDDDVWLPDHLEKLLKVAVANDYEFVSSSYTTIIDGEERVIDSSGDNPPIGGTQTWLYRSYLKFMRYNINCWRKAWNRVNDTDIQERFVDAGVRVGYLQDVTTIITPRPGETQIGSKAYLANSQKYEKFFDFR